MYNLNPRYKMMNNDIDYMKKQIVEMPHDILLDLCPRIKIPINTLFYHSTKFTSNDILSHKTELYPEYNGCRVCKYKLPIPQENIGDKPRIMELSANPNKNVGKKADKKCICLTGQQERLYGNFNFAGNYSLDLGKTVLKGTEILINDKEIILIDLNYISAELGFSPKHFFMGKEEKANGFAKQSVWQTYCRNNGIDGIIMVDIVDVQDVCLNEKTILSCYNHVNPYNEKEGIACPEFVLISTIGNQISPNPIGTEKLKILGMVNLYNDKTNSKLDRQEVEELYHVYFEHLYTALNYKNKVSMELTYYDNFTIFKQLTVIQNNHVLNTNEIFYNIKQYINDFGSEDFYIDINKSYIRLNSNIYHADLCFINKYNQKDLELFEPEALSHHVELYTDIIVNNILPKNNNHFYFKNGVEVTRYASDYIFDYVIYHMYDENFNRMLFINYYLLSSIRNYEKYTLDYFQEQVYQKTGRVKSNIKDLIDDLEQEIIANFYLRCYIVNSNLTMNHIEFYTTLYGQIMTYLHNNFNYKPFRNKNWQQFKTAYLPETPEKYVCYLSDYKDTMVNVVQMNNFMVKYLYDLLLNHGYVMDIPLEDILDQIDDPTINVRLFNYYTQNINHLDDVYEVFNKTFNELFYMTI